MASYIGMTIFPQYINFVSGPIFIKLANVPNPSCLSPTLLCSFRTHETQRALIQARIAG